MKQVKQSVDKEKFFYLLTLTKIHSNKLAEACHYSPSYISKILSGKRTIPYTDEFINSASRCFAYAINSNVQKKSASNAILKDTKQWPEDAEEGTKLIAAWIRDDSNPLMQKEMLPSKLPSSSKNGMTFFGNEGKRKAVLTALTMLEEKTDPINFYIYSDENIEWFTEDPMYLKSWQQQLEKILDKGGEVTSIFCEGHLRNHAKLGLKMWLPFIIKGKVKVFADIREDDIYHKTLFIAGNDIGIISSSIGDDTMHTTTIITDDPATIQTLHKEYDEYLKNATAYNGNRLGLLIDRLGEKLHLDIR